MDNAHIDQLVEKYHSDPSYLIQVMLEIQEEHNWLPKEALERVADKLSVPMTRVMHIATFYKAFSLEPRGRHIVQVCMGTACHVRGAQRILDELERRLGVAAGATTKDGRFTLETVNCLGACALGPIVAVDGEFHGSMTAAGVPRLIERYVEGDAKGAVTESGAVQPPAQGAAT